MKAPLTSNKFLYTYLITFRKVTDLIETRTNSQTIAECKNSIKIKVKPSELSNFNGAYE